MKTQVNIDLETLNKLNEEIATLQSELNQSQFSLNEYQGSLQSVLTFVKVYGYDEEMVEWLMDYSHLKPKELNQDQINGVRECLENI
ncbi:hypothetical protein [Paenibacillus sp. O199]|uniref:hypothetical protein n=1 Tax=Paenibacillus sp. O199 TaxID=1643925 RepID=UPI0007BF4042|nr:hypothetical protein [Paenibacillus sp. O199]